MKRSLAKLIAAGVAVMALIPQTTYAHEKSVGLRGGYTTKNETGVAGLYFQYRFVERFRLAAEVDYYVSHNDTDAFSFNLNGHVPFDVASKVEVYPLAGFTFTTFSHHDVDDNSTRANRFGANVGAGLGLNITPTLRLGFEGKYQYIKDYASGVFTVSIGYRF